MSTTTPIYNPITDSGVIVVDTSEIKSDVQQSYLTALGEDLDLGDETPQGVLISAQTAERIATVTAIANAANQINPNVAGGVFLDAIAALTRAARGVGTRSTFAVDPIVAGVAGTVIPAGALAVTQAGDNFQTVAEVVIPGGGSITAEFESVARGEIPCAVNGLAIVNPISGWETISNSVIATLGTSAPSDVAFRTLRNDTLAAQGTGTREAITSAIPLLDGVFSVVTRDNSDSSSEVVDGVNLDGNSVWVCVQGGDDTEIAERLNAAKNIGGAWQNGKSANPVAVVVVDPYNTQPNTVLFDRPNEVPVEYALTVLSNGVTNVIDIVRNAVLSFAAGEIDGLGSLGCGTDVSPFTATAAVNAIEPRITVINSEVTTIAAATLLPVTVEIALFEIATVLSTNIAVIVDPAP